MRNGLKQRGRTLALLLLGAVVSSSGREWTLDELLSESLRSSRQIEAVLSEMQKVDAQIRQAYGSALPHISATANYQHSWEAFNPTASLLSMPEMGSLDTTTPAGMRAAMDMAILGQTAATDTAGFDGAAARAILGIYEQLGAAFDGFSFELPRNTVMLGLSLQQPLYAQGKVTVGLKVARLYKEGLLCKYEATRQKVVVETTKLFYGTLLAQEALRIHREALALADESHRLAVVRFSLGHAGEVDTFATRFAVEQAGIEARAAQSQYQVARVALSRHAGIAESPGTFSLRGDFPEASFAVSLDEALRLMRDGNKTLGQLQSGEGIQEQLVRLEKTEYRPLVYCGATLSKFLLFDSFGDIDWNASQNSDKAVFIGASYTLFSGLQRRQKIRQAGEDLRQFQLTFEQVQDGLEVAVHHAWETVETSRAQLSAAASLVDLASKGHALARKGYEVGLATLLELQRAENNRNGAHLALNAAKFAFHSAVLDLKLLTGDIVISGGTRTP